MTCIDFTLRLPPEQLLQFYRGQASSVVARLDDGRTLQFPLSAIRRFVTPEGVHGRFRITFDEAQKLVGVERAPQHR